MLHYVNERYVALNVQCEAAFKVWNEVVDKVNTNFEGNRKIFWSFVGRKTRGKKSTISSLKNEAIYNYS